ncbi:hypothetical protein pb186bvf_010235 [Paramecium bursaria]
MSNRSFQKLNIQNSEKLQFLENSINQQCILFYLISIIYQFQACQLSHNDSQILIKFNQQ